MAKTKQKIKPCTCEAYPFPHRLDSGKCRELYNETPVETNDFSGNAGWNKDRIAMDDAGHKPSDFY
jgi:hypothetical protein